MSETEKIGESVKEIVLRITRKPDADFSSDTQFKDLEADSLDIVQILVALEDTFDIEIDDEEIRQVKNMGELVAYIQSKQADK